MIPQQRRLKKLVAIQVLSLCLLLLPIPNVRAQTISERISTYIQQLESADLETQRKAANALWKTGPGAKAAIPQLLKFLKSPVLSARVMSALVLGNIGAEAETVVPALIAALQDPEEEVRANANIALEKFGPAAKAALPDLLRIALQHPGGQEHGLRGEDRALAAIDTDASFILPALRTALQDSDVNIRVRAVELLSQLPEFYQLRADPTRRRLESPAKLPEPMREIPALLQQALTDRAPQVRLVATTAMGRLRAAGLPVDTVAASTQLGALLQDPDAKVRASAVVALRWSTDPPTALAKLLPVLNDPAPQVRISALSQVVELGVLGGVQPALLSQMILLLSDRDAAVRVSATNALAELARIMRGMEKPLPPKVQAALPQLRQLLTDPNIEVRASAIAALPEIDPDAAAIVPELTALLRDSEPRIRAVAVSAFGSLGTNAKAAIPELLTLLRKSQRENSFEMQRSILWGLWQIDLQAAIPAFVEVVKSLSSHPTELTLTLAQFTLLPEMRSAIAPALPDLLPLLQHPDPDVQRSIISLLGAIGETSPLTVPTLTSLLDSSDQKTVGTAAMTLAEIGPPANSATPKLLNLLEASDRRLQILAALTLVRVGAAPDRVLPKVLPWLTDRDPQLQLLAGVLLEQAGQPVKAAIPQLQTWLSHTNPEFREIAAKALGNMGKAAQIAVPDLIKLLPTPDPATRAKDEEMLQQAFFNSQNMNAFSNLNSRDYADEIRTSAAITLGKLGATAAMPSLITNLSDDDLQVQIGAAFAIGAIAHANNLRLKEVPIATLDRAIALLEQYDDRLDMKCCFAGLRNEMNADSCRAAWRKQVNQALNTLRSIRTDTAN